MLFINLFLIKFKNLKQFLWQCNLLIIHKLIFSKINRIICILVFILSIFFFLSSKNNILIIKRFASGIEYELKYCKIENYLKLCDNNKFKIDEKAYKKVNSPKVSIISPIFNRERFIIRLFNSIRYQKFEDNRLLPFPKIK